MAALAVLLLAGACTPRPEVPEITIQELKARMDRKERFILLDVREPREYAKARIEGSTLIPLGFLGGPAPARAGLRRGQPRRRHRRLVRTYRPDDPEVLI